MCDKVILENGGMFIPDSYKDKKMCNESADNCAHALGFVPDCHKAQKTCDKAVSTYPFAIQFVSDRLRLKKYVIKLSILVLLYLILFLINI